MHSIAQPVMASPDMSQAMGMQLQLWPLRAADRESGRTSNVICTAYL